MIDPVTGKAIPPKTKTRRPRKPHTTARDAKGRFMRLEQNLRMTHRPDTQTLERQLRDAHELLRTVIAALELFEVESAELEKFCEGLGLFASAAELFGL